LRRKLERITLMLAIEIFHVPSATHLVREENGGFTIYPRSSAQNDIENFQRIARQALSYRGSDYQSRAHTADGAIDEVFFERFSDQTT
jgi:hypothetical protein